MTLSNVAFRKSSARNADRHRGELDLLHSTAPSDTYSAGTYRRYQPHGHLLAAQSQVNDASGRRQYGYIEQQPFDDHYPHQQFYHRLSPFTATMTTNTVPLASEHTQRGVVSKTTPLESADDSGISSCPTADYGSNNAIAAGGGSFVVGGPLCVVGGGCSHLYEAPATTFVCCSVNDPVQIKQQQQQFSSKSSSCVQQMAATHISS